MFTGGIFDNSGGAGAIASVSNSDGTLTISPTTGSVVASLNLAHANTWTGQQGFNGGITQAGTTTQSSGGFTKNGFYVAPIPSGTVTGSYTSVYAAIQYNSSSDTSGSVQGIEGYAELFGQGGANICTGVIGVAVASANAGAYGASQSLYGGQFQIYVNGTSTFNHGIGVKVNPPTCNGNTTYTSGFYVADQTNAGSATISTQDAIHIEGSGVKNAIGWGNGSSGINAYLYSPSANALTFNASGNITHVTGATKNIILGASSSVATYNMVSVNGDMTNGTGMGILGGGDNTLYFIAPSAGSYQFRCGNTSVATMDSTGALNVASETIGSPTGGNKGTGTINTTGVYVNGGACPSVQGNGRFTAQTAAKASVATLTVGAADSSYLVSANVLVTAATTASFTVTCAYTDESNSARTLTLNFSSVSGTLLQTITNVTGAGAYEGVPLHIRAKAGTTITMATVGTFTSVTYNVEGYITQIG